MSAFTPSRLGQVDLAGDAKAIFLKVFAGEVLTAYEQNVILKELHRTRTISSGKSAQFPAVYQASTEYHTPGAEIDGKRIRHAEVVINIDDLLIAPVFVANIDEAMNHYDVRSIYTTEMGRALAIAYDKNVARNLVRAARASALFTGDVGGQSVTEADARTNGAKLADAIWASKQKLEEADVPVDIVPVTAALKPAQWYLLAQETTKVINRDVGGQADYANGRLTLIGGVNVRKSNAFPWAVNDSANTDIPTDYRVNMTNTAAVVFTEAAAATVQLMGMSMEDEYSVRHQGTLMVGKYAVGHGPLIPKAAVEIKVA
jgi:hypothetical protein